MNIKGSSLCRRAVAAVALCSLALVGCSDDGLTIDIDDDGIPGSGDRVIETRDVAGFDQIVLAGEGEVIVTSGTDESLSVETDDNLLQYIESEVVNGALELRTTEDVDIAPTMSVVYRVGADAINFVSVSGAGSVQLDVISATEGRVLLTGVGDVRVSTVDVENLTVLLSGVGSIRLEGTAGFQGVTLTGVGEYDGEDLRSATARVESTGTASAVVWVVDELDLTVSGTGSVSYYGSPAVTPRVSGLGGVEPLGAK